METEYVSYSSLLSLESPPFRLCPLVPFTCLQEHSDRPASVFFLVQPAERVGQRQTTVRGDLGLGPDQPQRLHGVLVVWDF